MALRVVVGTRTKAALWYVHTHILEIHLGDWKAFAYQMSQLLLLRRGRKQMHCCGSRDDCSVARSLLWPTRTRYRLRGWAMAELVMVPEQIRWDAVSCVMHAFCFSKYFLFPLGKNTSDAENESTCKLAWPLMLLVHAVISFPLYLFEAQTSIRFFLEHLRSQSVINIAVPGLALSWRKSEDIFLGSNLCYVRL